VKGVAFAAAATIGAGAALASDSPAVGFVARSAASVPVRKDGRRGIAEDQDDSTQLRRYSGFAEISDLSWYEAQTLLVAEGGRDRISALSLEGRILWEGA